MQGRRNIAVILWLVFLLACAIIISRTRFTTDLSAFLPHAPTAQQKLLVDQLRDGLASRLILTSLEGGDAELRVQISRELAQQLRADSRFVGVSNGENINAERDQAYLFDHRYLLSNKVTPAHFSVQGLHDAFSDSIDLLASPAGLLVKSLLPRDPTGEMMQVLDQIRREHQPKLFNGVWVSGDGARTLLLLQTRASGADIDAQQQAMQAVQQAYALALQHHTGADSGAMKLSMTGPGVFSVSARNTIKTQVTSLSLISFIIIASVLLLVYRSFTALLLGMLPVISGAMAGVVAVSLVFGVVHGITLGFGTALIGEAVDYSIYLFVQSEKGSANREDWVRRFWPTIRLGVMTSVIGFASLLLSGFPGLAQLGLYAIAGLVVAALVTRLVLPRMLPADFRIHDVSAMGDRLSRLSERAPALRKYVMALVLAACVITFMHRDSLWNRELASLSPVSAAEQALDAKLRADMGAPDVRYLIVVSAASQEATLLAAEQVSLQLQGLVSEGVLGGFDSPSLYLPSEETQRSRINSLPDRATLTKRLAQASRDLPVSARLFQPFMDDVSVARTQPLLQRSDLDHTSMAMAVDGLLLKQKGQWSALMPLTTATGASMPVAQIADALKRSGQDNAIFVDLKAESDHLYAGYLDEAIKLSLGGLFAIIVLLLFVLRSVPRVLRVIAPLAAAVISVIAMLSLFGQQLIILHLVGLLLVVAIGSNYALFFDNREQPLQATTLASIFFANLTTLAGFGLLAFSSVPVLQAIGSSVAPGVLFALVYSAILGKNRATLA